jgi:predicted Fe-Mo cluster-binding NifX family protein
VQAAQAAANKQVEAVITGSVGPNAFQTLSAAGVKIFTGANGTVKDAIIDFKEGKLQETRASTVGPQHGMGNQSPNK